MKILKNTLSVLLALVLVLLPFVTVVTLAVALPPQYSDTFVGALDEKYNRLTSIEEDKIVVVGGSSVAFGLDSERLERYTGMPVVNFGLYAALGTKLMLDLSRRGIEEGDIVVLTPEMDPQTLSLYFSSENTLKAIDDDFSLFFKTDVENWFPMLGGMWRHASDKLERYLNSLDNPNTGSSTEIYQSKYFDEYGDFDYPRENNIMQLYFDQNTPIDLDKDNLKEEFYLFTDYLNEYIEYCERRGATVYFSFPPMNELALTSASTDPEIRAEFVAHLEEEINCPFITEIDDMIMDAGYFFDTNFHLNDAGVIARTFTLGEDLCRVMELGDIDDDVPPPPALPSLDSAPVAALPESGVFTAAQPESGAVRSRRCA